MTAEELEMFGEAVPGEAVKPRAPFDPCDGYEPRKRFVRSALTGKSMRVDDIPRKDNQMTPPTAVANRTIEGTTGIGGTVTITAAPPAMNVYGCIVAVSRDIAVDGISKSRKNATQGYQFRGIDDVLNALSPLLARHGLVILPRVLGRNVVERETRNGGVLFYVTVECEFDFVSAFDGSIHTVKTYGEAMDSADKATNKAMSAAYKYAAFQTFCIPTEGDNDADAVTHDVRPRSQAPAGSPRPAPEAPNRLRPSVPNGGDSGRSDEGPDLGTADPDGIPEGFALIRDYKLDGDWHQVWWGRDGSDGVTLYKTKLAKIGLKAHNAYTQRHPVKLHSKKPPFLDDVESLGMSAQDIKATKFQHDDPKFCDDCGRPAQECMC